ncbi:MAG: cyclopropane fatty acyl phospholipid synthase [Gammaproteobacteria bacterium]|nr:cyclopropane fatty acyl phospholipid synthase [Gammaproteobacteria bacterium]
MAARQSSPQDIVFKHTKSNQMITDLLSKADIDIGGDKPWDIHIYSSELGRRILAEGNLGLGEAYIDGDWEAPQLDQFFHKVISAGLEKKVKPVRLAGQVLKAKLLNRQSLKRAWQVGEQHYDIGNDFYEAMLDKRMTYTCGFWANASNLDEAQEHKLDMICRKLDLKPGQRVLDIGCGWGSFMSYAAENYGVECVGLTISKEQAELGKEKFQHLPIEFRLQDYRTFNEQFDHIVSIGMFEHVGPKNYRTYFEMVNRCLKQDGLFLLHTIGKNHRRGGVDPWIDKYIFPNGELPAISHIGNAIEDLFVVEDLHNFGADYDTTLMAWYENFEAAWPRFKEEMGERFYRMWRYYLLSCAGAFRARDIQLWQWVLSRDGVAGGYRRISE